MERKTEIAVGGIHLLFLLPIYRPSNFYLQFSTTDLISYAPTAPPHSKHTNTLSVQISNLPKHARGGGKLEWLHGPNSPKTKTEAHRLWIAHV
jgi:hypothetical protein